MSLLNKDLRLVAVVVALAGLGAFAGCGRRSGRSALARLGAPREQITSYTVRKPEKVDPTLVARTPPPAAGAGGAATEQQTLGLIVPVGGTSWFFKLTGDLKSVEPQHEAFLEFVTSIKFSPQSSKPTWTLPPGWKEQPGKEFRFATIQIPAEGKPLEISVSSAGGDLLSNINRWRGQLNMKPISAEEIEATTKPLTIDGRDATLVSLVGTGSGGMGGAPFAPFAGGGSAPLPADHPPIAGPKASAAAKNSSSGDLRYEAPPSWTPGTPTSFSLAAFKVVDGEKQADITVSSVGGDLYANATRWCGQIGLDPLDRAALAKITQKIDTFGTSGEYVELVGPKRETILGVRADAGGGTWFVRLRGDSELAAREKSNFEAFVKSLKLK